MMYRIKWYRYLSFFTCKFPCYGCISHFRLSSSRTHGAVLGEHMDSEKTRELNKTSEPVRSFTATESVKSRLLKSLGTNACLLYTSDAADE